MATNSIDIELDLEGRTGKDAMDVAVSLIKSLRRSNPEDDALARELTRVINGYFRGIVLEPGSEELFRDGVTRLSHLITVLAIAADKTRGSDADVVKIARRLVDNDASGKRSAVTAEDLRDLREALDR